jgi:hypothetical protein
MAENELLSLHEGNFAGQAERIFGLATDLGRRSGAACLDNWPLLSIVTSATL